MQYAGIDELTGKATDNAQAMDISDQFPEKRKKRVNGLPSEQAKDEGIVPTPQQKFGHECLEVQGLLCHFRPDSVDTQATERRL